LCGKSSGCNVCILNIEHFYGEPSFPAKLSLLLTQAITHKFAAVGAVCAVKERKETHYYHANMRHPSRKSVYKSEKLLSIKMRKILWNILTCISFTLEKRMLSNIGIPFSGNLRNGKVQNTCCSGVAAQRLAHAFA